METKQPSPLRKGEIPEKLLYESKGGQSARVLLLGVFGIVLMLLGVFITILAASTSLQRAVLGGRFANVGGVFVLGVIFFIFGGIVSDAAAGMQRCWLKIYSSRIEAQAMSFGLNKSFTRMAGHQIESVQLQGYLINVTAGGRKVRLVCKDPSRAYQLILDMSVRR